MCTSHDAKVSDRVIGFEQCDYAIGVRSLDVGTHHMSAWARRVAVVSSLAKENACELSTAWRPDLMRQLQEKDHADY